MKSFKCTIDDEGHRHFDYKINEAETDKRKARKTLSDVEIQNMLDKADKIEHLYFKLRAKAVVAIARLWGKRRSEIASVLMDDVVVEEDNILTITFTLSKKRKKGLWQYREYLKRQIEKGEFTSEQFNKKSQGELETEWREWQKTKEGINIKTTKASKSTDANGFFAQIILEYRNFVHEKYPKAKFLFPYGTSIWGTYHFDFNDHINGRTILNIVKALDSNAWAHLFRERRGAAIARKNGRSLDTVYKVKDALDLENEETAYSYVKRYARDVVKEDEEET
jgi:integrase